LEVAASTNYLYFTQVKAAKFSLSQLHRIQFFRFWFRAISDKTDVELNLLGQNRKHDD
jgi:hypothetical protein